MKKYSVSVLLRIFSFPKIKVKKIKRIKEQGMLI